MCRCAPSAKARTGSLRPHLRPTLSSMHPLAEQCTRRVPLQIKSAAPAAATMLGPSAATWRFMLPHRRATSMSLSFRRPPVRSVVRADLRAHCFRLRLHSKRCGGGRPPLSGIPCCLGYHAVCYCAIDTNPTAVCLRAGITSARIPRWKASSDKYARLIAQPRRTGHCGLHSIDRLCSRLLSIGVGLRGLRRCAVGRNCKPGFFL